MEDSPYTRPHWSSRASAVDTAHIVRWFRVETFVELKGQRVEVLVRVLGWDDSTPPAWVIARKAGRLETTVEERRHDGDDVVPVGVARGRGRFELRRVELPVSAWDGDVSSQAWALQVPLVLYEDWCKPAVHTGACAAWDSLDASEQEATGLGDAHRPYFGSTVFLLPQKRPYLVGVHVLVLPHMRENVADIRLVSEVLDGPIVLARSADALHLEPYRELSPSDRLHYVRVHEVADQFAAMEALDRKSPASWLAPYPRQAHGRTGSDWRVSVIGCWWSPETAEIWTGRPRSGLGAA